MSIYSSDYNNDHISARPTRLFGRKRPMHSVLGGGKAADVLLWRNKRISAALLIGTISIWFLFWFLFEVVEYNFMTLLCHISMTTMLLVFIWCKFAEFFSWRLPKIPKLLEDSDFRELTRSFHGGINYVIIPKLLDITYGRDLKGFVLAIGTLYILSIVGTYFSFVNLLFFGFICMETLPFLYDRYENDVDYVVGKWIHELKKTFRGFDSILNKIPRGPVTQKKLR